jgi:hypothetical protein
MMPDDVMGPEPDPVWARSDPFFSTWWRARYLRNALLEAVARED